MLPIRVPFPLKIVILVPIISDSRPFYLFLTLNVGWFGQFRVILTKLWGDMSDSFKIYQNALWLLENLLRFIKMPI